MTWSVAFRLRRYLRESLWVIPLVGGALGWTLGLALVPISARFASVSRAGSTRRRPPRRCSPRSSAASVGSRRLRRHGERPHRPDGDGDVLGPLHADLLSRLGVQGRARRADRHLHVLVHAHAARRGGRRPEPRRDHGRRRFSGSGILLFVVFLDRAIHRLRPVAVAALVAKAGRKALREVLEEAARPDAPAVVPAPFSPPGEPARVVRMVRGGAIQAIDFRGLGKWAHANDCLVVLRHPIGDFVSAGAALLDVYGPIPVPRRRTSCGRWSPSASSGRSSRTRRSPSGSWSTSRSARCLRP